MGVYKKAVITNAGRELMARSIAGEIVMQFSRAVTSSHIYQSDTDFKGYTSLEGIQQTVIPSNVQVVNDTLISVRSLFGNESISESYLIRNIGLYATDGNEEVLFSVSQATAPDEMPGYNGVAPSSFIYTVQATVSQASSLSLTINPVGTAMAQDIQDLEGAKLDKLGDISETVIETLETVDTKFPIPTVGETIKRFMGKILAFLKNIKPLEANVQLFVATTGSDITGDGTESKPFKTIQRAINSLPKDLGGFEVTIAIAVGTYDEDLTISGFKSGLINIKGINNNTVDVKVRSVLCHHNSAYVTIFYMELTTATTHGVLADDCTNVLINTVKCIGVTTGFYGMYFTETNLFRVYDCEISNKNRAVFANNSYGYVRATGVNNQFSVVPSGASWVSLISSYVPDGKVESVSGGMVINSNGTQISNWIGSGLSCTWGNIGGGYFRHGNARGAAMVTIQLRIAVTTNLTANQQYSITGFPAPVGTTNTVAVTTDCPSRTFLSMMANNGTIYFTPAINISSGSFNLLLSTTYMTNSYD